MYNCVSARDKGIITAHKPMKTHKIPRHNAKPEKAIKFRLAPKAVLGTATDIHTQRRCLSLISKPTDSIHNAHITHTSAQSVEWLSGYSPVMPFLLPIPAAILIRQQI